MRIVLDLTKYLGFPKLRTSTYQSQYNSLTERIHGTVKTVIADRKFSWRKGIQMITLAYAVHQMISFSHFFTEFTCYSILIPKLLISQPSNNA